MVSVTERYNVSPLYIAALPNYVQEVQRSNHWWGLAVFVPSAAAAGTLGVCVCVGWYVDASVPVCPLTSLRVVFVLFGVYASARQVHGPRPERVSFPII